MNYINHNDSFKIAQALTESGNIYGLSKTSTDSHLMKNSEWGMIVILGKSQYGKNEIEVTINSKNLNNGDKQGVTKEDGNKLASVYAVTGYNNANKEWNDYVEVEASPSTTGNIYGIYDISGGLWERTATYVPNATNTRKELENYGKSIAYDEGGNLRQTSTKYTMVYPKGEKSTTVDDASTENYKANTKIYGDCVRETSTGGVNSTSWNGYYSFFVGWDGPFAIRGGSYGNGTYAGCFAFSRYHGGSSYNNGFRAVLIAV